jgi:hypothetical protein
MTSTNHDVFSCTLQLFIKQNSCIFHVNWLTRPLAEKSLGIPMHDRSRRSSLCRFLYWGRRCINSTTLTTLFVTIPSIKPLSWLTTLLNNFTPNMSLLMSDRNNPHKVRFHHTKVKWSQSYKYLNQDPILIYLSNILTTSLILNPLNLF